MKRLYCCILLLLGVAVSLSAQSDAAADSAAAAALVERINQSGQITVVQPRALTDRLANLKVTAADNSGSTTTATHSRSGYRVQIYDSNAQGARDEAQRRQAVVQSRMGLSAYVRFDSPYWRVRVGDFHTRAEAEHALVELKRMFPGNAGSFRVVRDHIRPE